MLHVSRGSQRVIFELFKTETTRSDDLRAVRSKLIIITLKLTGSLGKAEELGGTMSQRDADPMQADQVGIPLCTQARTSLPFLGARMYRSEHISAIARIVL